MNKFQVDTTQFHKVFGHPAPETPALKLDHDTKTMLQARHKWIQEEVDELRSALDEDDYVGVIDALIDAAYFVAGTFTALGLDMEKFWDNVHQANMEKVGPSGQIEYGPDNKVRKPEGWQAPEARHIGYLQHLEHLPLHLRGINAAPSILIPAGEQLAD